MAEVNRRIAEEKTCIGESLDDVEIQNTKSTLPKQSLDDLLSERDAMYAAGMRGLFPNLFIEINAQIFEEEARLKEIKNEEISNEV